MAVGAASVGFLLCCMWDRTRWFAARAAIRESSPASTADPTIWASLRELSPKVRWNDEVDDKQTVMAAHTEIVVGLELILAEHDECY